MTKAVRMVPEWLPVIVLVGSMLLYGGDLKGSIGRMSDDLAKIERRLDAGGAGGSMETQLHAHEFRIASLERQLASEVQRSTEQDRMIAWMQARLRDALSDGPPSYVGPAPTRSDRLRERVRD